MRILFSLIFLVVTGCTIDLGRQKLVKNINTNTGLRAYNHGGQKVCELPPFPCEMEVIEEDDFRYKLKFASKAPTTCPEVFYLKKSRYVVPHDQVVVTPKPDPITTPPKGIGWFKAYEDVIAREMGPFFGQPTSYWVNFMRAMAKAESNWNPSVEFKESFTDQNGNRIISTGLFQISLESSRGYQCGFTSQPQLKDPIRNLSCSIRIIKKLVNQNKKIMGKVNGKWVGASRYWSVLRNTTSGYQRWLKEFTR